MMARMKWNTKIPPVYFGHTSSIPWHSKEEKLRDVFWILELLNNSVGKLAISSE